MNKDSCTIPEYRTFKKGDIVKSDIGLFYLIEGIVLDFKTKEKVIIFSELQEGFETYSDLFENFVKESDYEDKIQKYKFEKISRTAFVKNNQ